MGRKWKNVSVRMAWANKEPCSPDELPDPLREAYDDGAEFFYKRMGCCGQEVACEEGGSRWFLMKQRRIPLFKRQRCGAA